MVERITLLALGLAALGLAALGCGPAVDVPGGRPDDPVDLPGSCQNRVHYDDDADGGDDLTGALTFDAEGRLVRYVERAEDGAIRFEVTRHFEGARLVKQVEARGDAEPSRTIALGYDGAGRVATFTIEDPEYGSFIHHRTFDAQGRFLRRDEDTGGDGTIDRVNAYRWIDGEPLILEQGRDDGADGVEDGGFRYTFQDGRWVLATEIVDAAKETTARTSFQYAPSGPPAIARVDLDLPPGGVIEHVARYTLDEAGRVEHVDFDDLDDGVIDGSYDFVYDAEGRVLRRTLSSFAPSTIAIAFDLAWDGPWPSRMEQRDPLEEQPYRLWRFERGCPVDRSFAVRRSPIGDWMQNVDTIGYRLDQRSWWDDGDPFYW